MLWNSIHPFCGRDHRCQGTSACLTSIKAEICPCHSMVLSLLSSFWYHSPKSPLICPKTKCSQVGQLLLSGSRLPLHLPFIPVHGNKNNTTIIITINYSDNHHLISCELELISESVHFNTSEWMDSKPVGRRGTWIFTQFCPFELPGTLVWKVPQNSLLADWEHASVQGVHSCWDHGFMFGVYSWLPWYQNSSLSPRTLGLAYSRVPPPRPCVPC